jgi:hypothetical protein
LNFNSNLPATPATPATARIVTNFLPFQTCYTTCYTPATQALFLLHLSNQH